MVSKTSNTVIGVEMEISGAVTYASSDPAYLARYNEYVNNFY